MICSINVHASNHGLRTYFGWIWPETLHESDDCHGAGVPLFGDSGTEDPFFITTEDTNTDQTGLPMSQNQPIRTDSTDLPTQGSRIRALGLIVAMAFMLHVALFAALDSVAPLGIDSVDDSVVVIEFDDDRAPGSPLENGIRQVVVDAR